MGGSITVGLRFERDGKPEEFVCRRWTNDTFWRILQDDFLMGDQKEIFRFVDDPNDYYEKFDTIQSDEYGILLIDTIEKRCLSDNHYNTPFTWYLGPYVMEGPDNVRFDKFYERFVPVLNAGMGEIVYQKPFKNDAGEWGVTYETVIESNWTIERLIEEANKAWQGSIKPGTVFEPLLFRLKPDVYEITKLEPANYESLDDIARWKSDVELWCSPHWKTPVGVDNLIEYHKEFEE